MLSMDNEVSHVYRRPMTTSQTGTRSRTVTWDDPLAAAAQGARLSGLDYLTALLAGELPPPPISRLLGFTLDSVADGEAVFTCTPDESVYNPIGLVHGGLVCTLLDSAIGCAVQTQLAAGTGYTSLELKVSYLRPVRADSGVLTARGWVVRPGRRATFAEGSVTDGQGKVVATASGTCLVMAPSSR